MLGLLGTIRPALRIGTQLLGEHGVERFGPSLVLVDGGMRRREVSLHRVELRRLLRVALVLPDNSATESDGEDEREDADDELHLA